MTRLENVLTAVLSAVVLGGGGFAVGRVSSASPPDPPRATASPPARSSAGTAPGGQPTPGQVPRASSAAGYTNDQLATQIAQQAGTALAAHSPGYVTPPRVRQLGSAIPGEAQVNARANTITFSTRTVSFNVVAVPPGGPDMTFRIAGLTNPAVVVPLGATVRVTFINADTDEAHGWKVTSAQPPFQFGSGTEALAGALARPLGNPTPAGDGAETIAFTAGRTGSYQYVCPMPGHAQMGMHGQFDIR
jgi:rusticyanin